MILLFEALWRVGGAAPVLGYGLGTAFVLAGVFVLGWLLGARAL